MLQAPWWTRGELNPFLLRATESFYRYTTGPRYFGYYKTDLEFCRYTKVDPNPPTGGQDDKRDKYLLNFDGNASNCSICRIHLGAYERPNDSADAKHQGYHDDKHPAFQKKKKIFLLTSSNWSRSLLAANDFFLHTLLALHTLLLVVNPLTKIFHNPHSY